MFLGIHCIIYPKICKYYSLFWKKHSFLFIKLVEEDKLLHYRIPEIQYISLSIIQRFEMTWYRHNVAFCVDPIQGYYYRLNEDNKFCLLRKQMTSRLRLISGAGDTPERRVVECGDRKDWLPFIVCHFLLC